ncbi:hypothetical protein ABFX02_10G166950 [Erythranthe guttata]
MFKNNVEFIDAFDEAGTKSYKLAVNAFADQTNWEFISARNKMDLNCKRNAPKNKGITQGRNHYLSIDFSLPGFVPDGKCDKSKESSYTAQISGYGKVAVNSERALLKAVAHQAVSVLIDAS